MRVVNIIAEDAFPVPWAGLSALWGVFLAREANAHCALFGCLVVYVSHM